MTFGVTTAARGVPAPVAAHHDRILALVQDRLDLVLTPAARAEEGEFDFDLWADLRSPTGARRRAILDVTTRAAELGLMERPIDVLDEFVRPVDGDWPALLGWAEAFREVATAPGIADCYERAGRAGQALARRLGELISAAAEQAAIVLRTPAAAPPDEATLASLYALHGLVYDGVDLVEAYARELDRFASALAEIHELGQE